MICIGVCGKDSDRVADQICAKYFEAGIEAVKYTGTESSIEFDRFIKDMESNGKNVVVSETSIEGDRRKFDILMVISAELKKISMIKNVSKQGYIIINADDCGIFPYIPPSNVSVITCGVNSSASVTFSGIGENKDGRECIQCCIQREIRTISGRKIEPQEFSIKIVGVKYPISEVLSIITLAIAGDIEETVTSDCLV